MYKYLSFKLICTLELSLPLRPFAHLPAASASLLFARKWSSSGVEVEEQGREKVRESSAQLRTKRKRQRLLLVGRVTGACACCALCLLCATVSLVCDVQQVCARLLRKLLLWALLCERNCVRDTVYHRLSASGAVLHVTASCRSHNCRSHNSRLARCPRNGRASSSLARSPALLSSTSHTTCG